MTNSQDRITITLTLDQANALTAALDLYTRVGLGQLEEISNLCRDGTIPRFRDGKYARIEARMSDIETVESAISQMKSILGYTSGGSMGIGHPHVCIESRRCYEMRKVIERVIAMHRDPSPKFHTVNYDGLMVRYTNDLAPEAVIKTKE